MPIDYGNSRLASEAESVAASVGPLGPQTREGAQAEADSAGTALAGNDLNPRERAAVQQYQARMTTQANEPVHIELSGMATSPKSIDYGDSEAVEPGSIRERLVQAFAHGSRQLAAGFGDVGSAILAPYDLAADAVQGRPIGTGNRERRASINDFADNPDPGIVDTLVRAAPEMLATGGPIAGVERQIVGNAPRFLQRTLGAGADVATNSAYAAAQAAAKGEDPGQAAVYGAGGSAAGRLFPRALAVATQPVRTVANKLTTGMAPEARTLMQAGATPTYGQAYPGGTLSRIEELSKRIPGFGSAVERAQGRTGAQYAKAELDDAMASLGIRIDGEGLKAVQRANVVIDRSYDDLVPRTFLDPNAAGNALHSAAQDILQIPGITQKQFDDVLTLAKQRIWPMAQQAAQAGKHIDGRAARDLDIELGTMARKYSGSPDPAHHALGDALTTLQQHLRAALGANDQTALQQLAATNEAFRRMVPVVKAADRAGNKRGIFTPNQYRQAAQGGGALNLSGGPLNDAAMEVIGPQGSGRYTRDMLTTGAAMANFEPSTLATILGLHGAGRVLYSEPATKFMLGTMNLLPHIRSWVEGLPWDKQFEFVARLAKEDPLTRRQLASQVGRQIATQQGAMQ